MWGTIVNSTAIAVGVVVGVWFGSRFSKSIKDMLMQAIGLVVILIGLQMALAVEEIVVVLVSMVAGAWLGEALNIEGRLEGYGKHLEGWFSKLSPGGNMAEAFVTSTIMFCVGAMAIMGALDSGLVGDHTTLYAKSIIDGVTAIVLTSILGVGVLFSAVAVLIYQGLITIAASQLEGVLTIEIINELRAVGGLIIVAIGFNLLDITKIKVSNLIPAIVIVVVLMALL